MTLEDIKEHCRTHYEDGVALSDSHPETFSIPSTEAKDSIVCGDYVKLGFKSNQSPVGSERMWVKVVGFGIEGIVFGALANYPSFLDGLKYGDLICFNRRNILNIEKLEKTNGTT